MIKHLRGESFDDFARSSCRNELSAYYRNMMLMVSVSLVNLLLVSRLLLVNVLLVNICTVNWLFLVNLLEMEIIEAHITPVIEQMVEDIALVVEYDVAELCVVVGDSRREEAIWLIVGHAIVGNHIVVLEDRSDTLT